MNKLGPSEFTENSILAIFEPWDLPRDFLFKYKPNIFLHIDDITSDFLPVMQFRASFRGLFIPNEISFLKTINNSNYVP